MWNSALTIYSSGTAKVWLGFASLHSVARLFQPFVGALAVNKKLTHKKNKKYV